MPDERWEKIKSLYDQAIQVSSGRRSVFLADACAGDEELRHEIESLLNANEQSDQVIEEVVGHAAADLIASPYRSSLSGRTVGHYHVGALLGVGGMGQVYRAHDSKLGRDVALKTLPTEFALNPEWLARFRREARTLASLNHPNIEAIYGLEEFSGATFLVLELVEGETLEQRLKRRPISIDEALPIAKQIAEALEAAHECGIIHRDLKPANMKITAKNVVKVLDFGLAKSVSSHSGETVTLTGGLTETGLVMGTPCYMSPEQLRGEDLDRQTDIWAYGCVLYEVLTGERTFQGKGIAEQVASVLTQEPDWSLLPAETSSKLRKVLQRSLAKNRERRYQNIGSMRHELEGGSAAKVRAALPQRPQSASRVSRTIDSLAVLPFANTSGDPDMEYLSEGITDSLMSSLSGIKKLRLIPRSLAFRHKGPNVDAQAAGSDLKALAVLTGRVLLRGDTLVIGAELLDVANVSQIWGVQYRRKLADIFAIEEEIAREIFEKLRVQLSGGEKKRLSQRSTQNKEAYQLYLKGRHLWNRRTRDSLERAIEYFQQAVDRDPAYALAYAGLADCFSVLGSFSFWPPEKAFPSAKAQAQRAIEIEKSLAEPHITLAIANTFFDLDRANAEREFSRGISLNPAYAVAHQWFGAHLCFMADFQNGLAELRQAQQLEPLSPMVNVQLGVGLYLARRYDEAVEVLEDVIALEPDFWPAHLYLGIAYGQRPNDHHQAITSIARSADLSGRHPLTISAYGYLLSRAGKPDQAIHLLEELRIRSQTEYIAPYHLALIHLALGDHELALERLEEDASKPSPYRLWLTAEPRLDALRADARFQAVLQNVLNTLDSASSRKDQE